MSQIKIPPNSRESVHVCIQKINGVLGVHTLTQILQLKQQVLSGIFSLCRERPNHGNLLPKRRQSSYLVKFFFFWKLSSINISRGLVGWILPKLPKDCCFFEFPIQFGQLRGLKIIASPSAFLNFQINEVEKCSKGKLFDFPVWNSSWRGVTWQLKPTPCFLEEPKDMKPSWHPVLPRRAVFQRFHCTLKSECSLHLESFSMGRSLRRKWAKGLRAVSQHLGPEINGFPTEMNRIL